MTLLAATTLPAHILYEDLIDLSDILEATGRAIPRWEWAEECIAEVNDALCQTMAGI